MAKCPYCKKEISMLENVQDALIVYEFRIIKGEPEYSKEPIDMDNVGIGTNEWECPECNGTIAYNEDDAFKFLIGKGKK